MGSGLHRDRVQVKTWQRQSIRKVHRRDRYLNTGSAKQECQLTAFGQLPGPNRIFLAPVSQVLACPVDFGLTGMKDSMKAKAP